MGRRKPNANIKKSGASGNSNKDDKEGVKALIKVAGRMLDPVDDNNNAAILLMRRTWLVVVTGFSFGSGVVVPLLMAIVVIVVDGVAIVTLLCLCLWS